MGVVARKDAIIMKVGEVYPTNSYGDVEVIENINGLYGKRIKVRFLETGNERECNKQELKRGEVADKEAAEKVSKVFSTRRFGDFEIIAYDNKKNVTIRFLNTGYVTKTQMSSVYIGSIKDPMIPHVSGVGFIGVGEYSAMESPYVKSPAYQTWVHMIRRCYSGRDSTYKEFGVTVDRHWHNYQNFAKFWYEHPYRKPGYHLEKDLIKPGNTVYCEDYCTFVPREVNAFFHFDHRKSGYERRGVQFSKTVGKWCAQVSRSSGDAGDFDVFGWYSTPKEAFWIYKKEKEKRAREVAENYKCVLDPRVYERLSNFEVDLILDNLEE